MFFWEKFYSLNAHISCFTRLLVTANIGGGQLALFILPIWFIFIITSIVLLAISVQVSFKSASKKTKTSDIDKSVYYKYH